MRRTVVFLVLIVFALLSGLPGVCGAGDRPRDPWVFRCVLDKQPRMVVIALHENLWVAYDATTCSLNKAWDGDVKFQGAVYDDVHGPQPESRGEAYVTGPHHGQLSIKQSDRDLKLAWRGYRYEEDGVTLIFDVTLADGSTVRITEKPEVEIAGDGTLQLRRSYTAGTFPGSVSMSVSYSPGGQPRAEVAQQQLLASGGRVVQLTTLRKAAEGETR